MLNKKWIVVLALAAVSASMLPSPAYAKKTSVAVVSEDDAFLALRDAARDDDAARASNMAARLADYAIPSYVDYYRLKARLTEATAGEIHDFLARYDGSAIADRLRNDWLLILGHAGDWKNFDEQYPQFVLNDDRQVKCYALISMAQKGQNVAADARLLLTAPKEYGDACAVLIKTLLQNGQFDQSDLDAQIRLAAESAPSSVVKHIAAAGGQTDAMLERAIDKPNLVLAHGPGLTRARHMLFIIALGREADIDVPRAVGALNAAAGHLSEDEAALGWAQIALQASLKWAPEAVDYWRKAHGAPLSHSGYRWKVRAALRVGDWKMVESGIEAMPEKLRSEPTWIYWSGRAMQANGRIVEAQAKFQSIAALTNFYGQLALEELGGKITIPPRPLPPTDAELAAIAENQGFRRALKLLELNLRAEGAREWNWELRKMSERQHFAVAEFARQNNILDRMVSTSEHTKTEMNFSQRYPTPFHEIMHPATEALGLDQAWVYGLIRQESRFIMSARSYVGAQGLMQIMPKTAKYVARKIGMGGYAPDQASRIDTNIMLGTNYLNLISNSLDGSEVLATAAYNAGPARPRAWRASLNGPLEGAIFTECIPFTETREYVRNVLSNATYYAAMFENKPQSLKTRLGVIVPKGFVVSDLP
ncbi:MAG: transglycosylase SLT domain-containing protein [Burkholderiales bacterium]